MYLLVVRIVSSYHRIVASSAAACTRQGKRRSWAKLHSRTQADTCLWNLRMPLKQYGHRVHLLLENSDPGLAMHANGGVLH
mmetsp:Transcript_72702/g.135848  ORF Transcript_72702/g.135848 Transcript_72702/m.135848 type:complete len:81 (-) Transcript_72702:9-251(-)